MVPILAGRRCRRPRPCHGAAASSAVVVARQDSPDSSARSHCPPCTRPRSWGSSRSASARGSQKVVRGGVCDYRAWPRGCCCLPTTAKARSSSWRTWRPTPYPSGKTNGRWIGERDESGMWGPLSVREVCNPSQDCCFPCVPNSSRV
jgi:hypothetical protein